MRYRARVDDTQAAIVTALRQAGVSVTSLAAVGGGVPDLLVGYRGQTALAEIKDGAKPPSRRRLRDSQQTWHDRWQGASPLVWESVEDALTWRETVDQDADERR